MDDERNHLFRDYAKLISQIKPNGFLFENVMGLLSMEKGKVFELVLDTLGATMPRVEHFVFRTEEYAIPQRRSRVVILGLENQQARLSPPQPLTSLPVANAHSSELAPAVTVAQALSDLPLLENGQDGEDLAYRSEPLNSYQRLMRGSITPFAYIQAIRARRLQ